MVNTCDICGFNHGPNDRYCGRCKCRFKRDKNARKNRNPIQTKIWSFYEKEKSSSKKKQPENENVIHWCTIRASCNSFDMSFPLFLIFVSPAGKRRESVRFCHCASCNRGYRELQAWIIGGTEKKEPHSPKSGDHNQNQL